MSKKQKKSSEFNSKQFKKDARKIWNYLADKKVYVFILLLIPLLLSINLRLSTADLDVTQTWARDTVYNNARAQISAQISAQHPTLDEAYKNELINQQYADFINTNEKQLEEQVKQTADYFKSRFQDDNGTTYLVAIDPYFYAREAEALNNGEFENGTWFDANKNAPAGVERELTFHPLMTHWTHKVLNHKYFDNFAIGFSIFIALLILLILAIGFGDSIYQLVNLFKHAFNTKSKNLFDLLGAFFKERLMVMPIFIFSIFVVVSLFVNYLTNYLPKLLETNFTVFATAFYMPLIFSVLAVIPAFFLARRLAGDTAGFFAGLIIAVHPSFLSRTIAGFSDTDPYNILFPLMIVWLLFEALHMSDKKGFFSRLFGKKETIIHKWEKPILLTLASSFFVGVFAYAWGGWWYVFDILIATIGIYGIVLIVKEVRKGKFSVKKLWNNEQFKLAFIVGLFFVIFSAIFVSLFTTPRLFLTGVTGPLGFSQIKSVGESSIWPNVYTTVAELNNANYKAALIQIGSLSTYGANALLFLIVILGVAITAFKIGKKDKTKKNPLTLILVLIWMSVILYATTKGVRFIMFLVPIFALAFGVALAKIAEQLTRIFSALDIKKGQKIMAFSIMVVFGLLLFNVIPTLGFDCPDQISNKGLFGKACLTSKGTVPSVSDAWVSTLHSIRDDSNKTAIINSWWDFGHQFMYFSDRGVIFDGASQGVAAHWTGRLLLTSDEKESIAISRMLTCSGKNIAFETLDSYRNDSLSSVELLKEIIMLEKDEAKSVLEKDGLTNEAVSLVLEKTHCEAPEHYIIASEDMIGKAGVWAHFGSWDFEKATIYNKVSNVKTLEEGKKILIDEFNVNKDSAEGLYYEIKAADADKWIAPWPGYVSSDVSCNVQQAKVICPEIGFTYEANGKATISTQQGVQVPTSMVFLDQNGDFKETVFENGSFPYSVSLHRSGNGYKAILSYPEIATSMFNRMFFFDGVGLNNYKIFKQESTVTGLDIYTYKVNWEEMDIEEEEEEEVVEETDSENESEDLKGEESMENSTNPIIVFETNQGVIEAEMFIDKTPITAGNFYDLVLKGFYDNLTFHRVIEDFMIQGGDPNGDGTGGPGYNIEDEFVDGLSNVRGTFSMANAGPNTGGSQFFINTVDNNFLDNRHAVFGKVIKGMEIVDSISKVPKNGMDKPLTPVVMEKVYVKGSN